jgi:hypothetical protein
MAMTATTTSSAQPDPRKKVATFRPRLDFPIECVAANAAAVCKNVIDTTVNSPILIAVDGNTLKLTLVMTLFGGRMSSVEELSRLHFTLTVEELLHVTFWCRSERSHFK